MVQDDYNYIQLPFMGIHEKGGVSYGYRTIFAFNDTMYHYTANGYEFHRN